MHEIIEALEADNDFVVPDTIYINPPENANDYNTDEDSGAEDSVTLSNLPGSQLRTEAQVVNFAEDYDSEDDVPLSQITKRRRTGSPSTSRESCTPSSIHTYDLPTSYDWVKKDLEAYLSYQNWEAVYGPRRLLEPKQYFEQLFNEHILEMILNYTNNYAAQKNSNPNITMSELACFIGVLLYSGYSVYPRRSMYWENSPDSGDPIVYDSISRDRFSYIMTNLHFCDNANLNPNDKFAKMRPLFDKLNVNSFDEAIAPYFSAHPCKQFIRMKPIRWGYKFWVGATRLGYVLWFSPYQGASTEIPVEYKKYGLGGSVVLQYADKLQESKSVYTEPR